MVYRDRTPKVRALHARLAEAAKSLLRADRAAVMHLRRFFEVRAGLADEMAGEVARDLAAVSMDDPDRGLCERIEAVWRAAAAANRAAIAAIDGFLVTGGGHRADLEEFAAAEFAALRATDANISALGIELIEPWGSA